MHSVVLFHTTSSALRLEKLCGKTGIKTKLIPVPRYLSSDCGVCLKIENIYLDELKTIIEINSVEIAEIHSL